MGNCQAAEAAAVVIQHPGGKVERLYGPATAGDVMRGNPGHYVALVVLRVSAVVKQQDPVHAPASARITKVKLLKPGDALLLGQVYRLITSQEVAKAIQARRQEKTRTCQETVVGDDERRRPGHAAGGTEQGKTTDQTAPKRSSEKDRHHRVGRGQPRHWRPSLRSISEFPTSCPPSPGPVATASRRPGRDATPTASTNL